MEFQSFFGMLLWINKWYRWLTEGSPLVYWSATDERLVSSINIVAWAWLNSFILSSLVMSMVRRWALRHYSKWLNFQIKLVKISLIIHLLHVPGPDITPMMKHNKYDLYFITFIFSFSVIVQGIQVLQECSSKFEITHIYIIISFVVVIFKWQGALVKKIPDS